MEGLAGRSLRPTRRIADTQRAFTLVEMILVLLVLSVVAGLSVPALNKSLTKHHFEKSADELLNLMRYAQSRAISRGNQVQLVFNETLKEYWLTETDLGMGATGDEVIFKRVPGRMGTTRRVPTEVELHNDDAVNLNFYADGRVDKAEIAICKKSQCRVISTRIQRGFIRFYDAKDLY